MSGGLYNLDMSSLSLAPSFLLSMPQLLDPNFSRTVVLLCKHSEDGAFGLVVNRPLVTAGPVVVEVRAQSDTAGHKTEVSEHELQVWVGGPVKPQSSWILDGDDSDIAEEQRGVQSPRPVSVDLAGSAAPAARPDTAAPHPTDCRVFRLGPRSTRAGARSLRLVDQRRRSRRAVCHAGRTHVGNGHPAVGRGPRRIANVARRALAAVSAPSAHEGAGTTDAPRAARRAIQAGCPHRSERSANLRARAVPEGSDVGTAASPLGDELRRAANRASRSATSGPEPARSLCDGIG